MHMRTQRLWATCALSHVLLSGIGFMAADDADGEFSLADLADLSVDDIAEIRFEQLPAGTYEFEVLKADLEETTNKDNEKRFIAKFDFKVLECRMTTKAGIDKEALVGKTHSEKSYINPAETQDKIAEAIGRLRAFVADMGCVNTGKLGEMVANTVGHTFKAKITERADPSDKSIVYARLRFEKKQS